MPAAWERAYHAIRRRLADGTFAPGEHLSEEWLAAELGVSRTPVREALRRLDAEGWVRLVPNHGAFAAPWSRRDIVEVFDLRALLEPHAAACAARAGDAAGLAALRAACAEAEAAMPAADAAAWDAITDANVRFHQALWAMSGQPRLAAVLAGLAVAPMMLRNFRNFDARGIRRSLEQHRELIAAIEARDADWAAAVMRAHVLAGRAVFLASAARPAADDRQDCMQNGPDGPAGRRAGIAAPPLAGTARRAHQPQQPSGRAPRWTGRTTSPAAPPGSAGAA